MKLNPKISSSLTAMFLVDQKAATTNFWNGKSNQAATVTILMNLIMTQTILLKMKTVLAPISGDDMTRNTNLLSKALLGPKDISQNVEDEQHNLRNFPFRHL